MGGGSNPCSKIMSVCRCVGLSVSLSVSLSFFFLPLWFLICGILLPTLLAFLSGSLIPFVDWQFWLLVLSFLLLPVLCGSLPFFLLVRYLLFPFSFVFRRFWQLLFFSLLPLSLLCGPLFSSFLLFPFGSRLVFLFPPLDLASAAPLLRTDFFLSLWPDLFSILI